MGKNDFFFMLSWPELKFLINLTTLWYIVDKSLSASFPIPPHKEVLWINKKEGCGAVKKKNPQLVPTIYNRPYVPCSQRPTPSHCTRSYTVVPWPGRCSYARHPLWLMGIWSLCLCDSHNQNLLTVCLWAFIANYKAFWHALSVESQDLHLRS